MKRLGVLKRREFVGVVSAGLTGAGTPEVSAIPVPQSTPRKDHELYTERIFGPETPTGRYKHPASFTELDSGDLYLVYYGGDGEYAEGTAVYGSRLKRDAKGWSNPQKIAADPFRSLGNAVVWQAPDGIVWLFYVVRYGETWSSSRIQMKISRDRARTWSDPSVLASQPGWMVRGRPIVLHDGDYLLPVYHETGEDREMVGPDSTSRFLRYESKRKQWREAGVIRSRKGNIQPAPAEIEPDHLIAYCRRGGNYEPVADGYIVRAESHDGGDTWSEGQNSQFPNPNAAVEFLKLASGSLLLVYNDSMSRRTPLTASLSVDGDRTYPFKRNLVEGDDSFAYPVALQTRDDKVHVIYTSQRRTVINHCTFEESWLREMPIEHVQVYFQPGRFGGWPANHGLWSWENEIVVGFGAGYYKDLGPDRHAIDREKPEEHLLARSQDGGRTWSIEHPGRSGMLVGSRGMRHGTMPPGLTEPAPVECPGGIDFLHPDFAMTVRMADKDTGESFFYYSTDRARNWRGPYRLPLFEQRGIMARTDYLVFGKRECLLFLTAAKPDNKEGRVLCVRTRDGGKTWKFLSYIGPQPAGYAIMPSTVRIRDSELLTTIRCREGNRSWIDAYRSRDRGQSWSYVGRPVPDTGEGNPPSLIRLRDGRLCLTYAYRAHPFSICSRFSQDDGRTWTQPHVLRDDGASRDLGYPRSVQRRDGKIVTAYYYHGPKRAERTIEATIWDPYIKPLQSAASETRLP